MKVAIYICCAVERGNFGRWDNFGRGPKKHLALSFDFLALVSALEVLTTVKKSKLKLKVKCFSFKVTSSSKVTPFYGICGV